MSNVTKKEFEAYREILNELSAFKKKCRNCGDRFRDYLGNKTLCTSCERDQKIDSILK